MRSTNRKRTLIVSGSVILLCMTIILGMTFALFTDTQTVKNHLQAGDLEVTLRRVELVKTTLDDKGYLATTTPDKTVVNFTDATGENLFGIETNEMIVPGSKYVAKMEIENKSDVAFGYWIGIECTNQEKGEDLAKQLKVTVNTGKDASDFINNGLVVKGENSDYVDYVAIGEVKEFTVTLEFLDSFIQENDIQHNDLAQGEALDFNIVVYAVQATTAP